MLGVQLALPLPTAGPVWSVNIVPIQELRDGFWDIVAEKLQEVKDKCDASWRVEDIYAQITARKAFCFAFYRDGDLSGITIARQDVDDFSGEKIAFCFAAWFDRWDDETGNAMIRFYDSIAIGMGATKVRFASPRLGWQGKKHGCKISTVIWERRPDGR